MRTVNEYLERAAAVIAEYPSAALAWQVQDPRLMAPLKAQAAMLAMHSLDQDVASNEPWTKARDVTVLADAAVKGVLPFGSCAQVQLEVVNVTSAPFEVINGRRMLDQQGRVYTATTGATVPANGKATIQAIQRTERRISHTVTESQGFYRIPVPAPDNGYIAEINVADSDGKLFTYTPEFTNINAGDRIFHLESDENRLIAVVFGANLIGGYQPMAGEVMNVTALITEGALSLSAGASFVFEHATTIAESGAKITLTAMLSPGSAPLDITALREITSYPSLYDTSAVYLGNFDFLVRKALSPFRFLSVWNEQAEEAVRPPDVRNINTLFIAAKKDGVADAVLRTEIERIIRTADNSYRFRHVNVIEHQIPTAVVLSVPDVYDKLAVKRQAEELILAQYGRESDWARRGLGRVLYRKVTSLLQANMEACRAEDADIKVTVTDEETIYPETYRYISDASLVVTVVNTQ